jgi:hypothetical protein
MLKFDRGRILEKVDVGILYYFIRGRLMRDDWGTEKENYYIKLGMQVLISNNILCSKYLYL